MIDKIDRELTILLKDLSKSNPNHFHAAQAVLGSPSARTALRLGKANGERKNTRTYDNLVSRFVKLFGRGNLVAEYLADREVYQFRIQNAARRNKQLDLDISPEGSQTLAVKVSTRLYRQLCPAEVTRRFKTCLGATDNGSEIAARNFGVLSTGAIASVLMHCNVQAKQNTVHLGRGLQVPITDPQLRQGEAYWTQLKMIQHTLLLVGYFLHTTPTPIV